MQNFIPLFVPLVDMLVYSEKIFEVHHLPNKLYITQISNQSNCRQPSLFNNPSRSFLKVSSNADCFKAECYRISCDLTAPVAH